MPTINKVQLQNELNAFKQEALTSIDIMTQMAKDIKDYKEKIRGGAIIIKKLREEQVNNIKIQTTTIKHNIDLRQQNIILEQRLHDLRDTIELVKRLTE